MPLKGKLVKFLLEIPHRILATDIHILMFEDTETYDSVEVPQLFPHRKTAKEEKAAEKKTTITHVGKYF